MKITLVRVMLELSNGRLKDEFIRINEETLSVITNKAKEHIDNRYIGYKILGVYIFEMVAELRTL